MKAFKNHTDIFECNPEEDLYENFWRMITTTDRVLLAETWLAEYDSESQFWIDKNTL